MSGCLNFGKLRVGQQVLGVIKAVNDFDLVVSLPNQLTGFVACDQISSQLTGRFSQATDVEGVEIPTLASYYRVGEVVVATIATIGKTDSNKGGASGKGRKRIELSLLPSNVNVGCTLLSLQTGQMVLAGEVVSNEDRGYTVDLAIGKVEKEPFVAFLPHAEVSSPVPVGKTLPVVVASSFALEKSNRVVSLSALPKRMAESVIKGKVAVEGLTIGSLVQAEVKAIQDGRLCVVFGGQHEGRIDILNLPDSQVIKRLKEVDLAEMFPVGKRLLARIVHVDREEKHFLLCCIQSIVQWGPSPVEKELLGSIHDGCTILRVDGGLGVVLSVAASGDSEVPSPTRHAYVHISRLSDEHVDRIEGGPYKVGSKHKTRIVEYDPFSGLYQASLQPSVLREQFLRHSDLHPGQTVRGQAMQIEPFGVVVSLSDRIRALCPVAQLNEIATSEAALKSYSVGQKYKFRILDCDPATRRITLTRKKGLLDSPVSPLTDYAAAQAGNWHDGYIVAIKEFGVLVRFFANVKGIITIGELAEEFVERPQDAFFVGQVVRCRIVKCDPSKPELVLSLRKSSGPKERPAGSFEGRRAKKARMAAAKDFLPQA